MKKVTALLILLTIVQFAIAQSIPQKLAAAVKQFNSDPQMKHAIMSVCVVDAKTGKQVYAHNEQIGLAPASTQKLFTSAAAYDMLGPGYRYKTELMYDGQLENGVLSGCIIIKGSGDPTLGSWRYADTKEELVLNQWVKAIQNKNIKVIRGLIVGYQQSLWDTEQIPDGWIWQDIGNYYGAGADLLNWRENQYDLILRAGKKIDDSVTILATKPVLYNVKLYNKVTTGAPKSGDNAYIYLPPRADYGNVRGTIPLGENEFSISGSFPNPTKQLAAQLAEELKKQNIVVENDFEKVIYNETSHNTVVLSTYYSPRLDSMVFWFLRRSINLYGEAFIKTIAAREPDNASTDNGVERVRAFLDAKGIDKAAVNIVDGSGLSPLNRVTTEAEVKVLQYAKSRPWYKSFYNSLPEYNGMKMKSGSINGARAYAGYHTSKTGQEYIFSIIVNNYDGSSGEAVKKLYRVLDVLK